MAVIQLGFFYARTYHFTVHYLSRIDYGLIPQPFGCGRGVIMFNTIHEAAEAIKGRRVSPVDLVEQCFAAMDQWEKHVHAWVFVDREYAMAEAKRLTDELQKNQYRGPLHGIPLGIKDIFDVYDWPTACGSKRWANSIARQDAPVIAALRTAGAIFLGKTVTTQYASFDPPVTKNPWNLKHTPGGSSSGSAVAVSTGMCLGALGSQTGGSICRPASYCGIAGLKPTYGLVPLEGIMPLAHSMDHPGPMAQNVMDLALLMRAMHQYEPYWGVNYAEAAAVPASRPRFGRVRQLFEERADDSVREMMDDIVHLFNESGASVQEVALPIQFSDVVSQHRIVMAVEAAQYHESRFRRHPEDYAPRITQLLEEGLACSGPEYARAKDHQRRLKGDMQELFTNTAPILISPATTGPAPLSDTTGDPAFNSPWSYTGLPTISIQTGYFADGLPLAIQLIGGEATEATLFSFAAWCEKRLAPNPLVPKLPS
jgi:Asp-tRNA(Asn)/Glu-tRNA(Gln) amidotransferase A subunit family amidase